MSTQKLTHIQSLDAFREIATACASGRPVIPLFGAGLSLDAGIPAPTQIGEYLLKVQYLSEPYTQLHGLDHSDANAWLNIHGWPDVNEVSAEILSYDRERAASNLNNERATDRDVLEYIVKANLKREFREVFGEIGGIAGPSIDESHLYGLLTQWRTLLRRLTGGDATLLDPFFTSMAQRRRPGMGHVYAAALCRLLGWRLLLTTNFDPLLETALFDAGLRPRSYDYREDGVLPDPAIVRRGISVLKLHGGRFSLRFSDILDTAADKSERERFLSYLGPRALLLVLGYRGADRRVMSLIGAHLDASAREGAQPALLWACRSKPPESLMRLADSPGLNRGIRIIPVHDVSRFLQELFTRSRPTYPSTTRGYSAITDAPTKTHRPGSPYQASIRTLMGVRAPVVAIVSDFAGRGTSTLLSIFARQHERSHQVIWCDLEEIPTVSVLVSRILHEMESSDATLIPLLLAHNVTAYGENATQIRPLHKDHDPRLSRLIDGLRRGKYFVAIDSMGEFGRSQVGHDLAEPAADVESRYSQLCDFLLALANSAAGIGESRVAFVVSPIVIPDSARELLVKPRAAASNSITTESVPAFDLTQPYFPTMPNGPTKIGDHPVVVKLGEGGQGEVYLVKHKMFNKHLAAKIFQPDVDSERLEIQLAEAQRAIQLDHPHIVRVFEAGRHDGQQPYVLYEFVKNGTLTKHLGKLSVFDAARIVAEVASALHHAHTVAGLVHRDVKPANILLTEDLDAKLVDFGMAISPSGAELGGGTFPYMSPEQITHFCSHGVQVGPATDIYSLGVVLYLLLTEQLPYDAPTNEPAEWENVICKSPIPEIANSERTIPKALAYICRKCLQKKPEERYRSAKELADAIRLWLGSAQVFEAESAISIQQRMARTYHTFTNGITGLASRDDATESAVHLEYAPAAVPYRDEGTERALKRLLDPAVNQAEIWQRIVGQGNSAFAAIKVIWESMNVQAQAILVVAAAFRRPRSIIALRRIGGLLLLETMQYPKDHILRTLVGLTLGDVDAAESELKQSSVGPIGSQAWMQAPENAPSGCAMDGEDGSVAEPSNQLNVIVDSWLQPLEEANFLIHQEGGYYWMHCAVRDAIFSECSRLEPQGMANLHEQIAHFYYDTVFRPTRDVRAFNEFVAHQLLAIREAPSSQRTDRLRYLLNCLDRERPNLLARTHPEIMLDWVHSIRDRELPRLKRPSSLAPSGTQPIETVITELLASLCDLEGDVHRYSTRYEACVKVRLGQLSHRFKELSDVNNPQDVQWIKKVIDRPDVRNGVVSEPWIDELCEQLRRSITELGLSLGPKRANESSGIYKRCMRHVMDIAICLQGMHFSRCARTLFDLLKSEVECLYCENSTQFVPITKGFPLTTRGWAARLGCSCSLRLMESWNREVYTWHDPDDMTTLLDNIAEEYQRALQGLQYYSREFRADFERNTCSMKTMFARTRYLRGRYEEAHILLDDAMASVSFEQDTDERMALAVCELRRAECLILEADRKCQTMTDASNLIGTARASLDLARSSLEHAWQILSAEPGHVWRWSLLFLERTQLIHEEILITFLGPDASSSLSCQTRSQLLRRGLAAVSAGLDNVEKDWMRWNQLAILWWQFYLCYFVDRDLQMSESWQSWEKLNQRAGLLWFCGIQRDEQFKKFNGRIEACREAISRQMENRESNRTLRQLVIDLERTVLAPERVPKSDTDQPS